MVLLGVPCTAAAFSLVRAELDLKPLPNLSEELADCGAIRLGFRGADEWTSLVEWAAAFCQICRLDSGEHCALDNTEEHCKHSFEAERRIGQSIAQLNTGDLNVGYDG